ncbi:MAG: hypothetical protein HZC44_00135 [Geobacter sp.]|nr:hypothetical protein [Geobacter sp.]
MVRTTGRLVAVPPTPMAAPIVLLVNFTVVAPLRLVPLITASTLLPGVADTGRMPLMVGSTTSCRTSMTTWSGALLRPALSSTTNSRTCLPTGSVT